jgi:hypothetical protein
MVLCLRPRDFYATQPPAPTQHDCARRLGLARPRCQRVRANQRVHALCCCCCVFTSARRSFCVRARMELVRVTFSAIAALCRACAGARASDAAAPIARSAPRADDRVEALARAVAALSHDLELKAQAQAHAAGARRRCPTAAPRPTTRAGPIGPRRLREPGLAVLLRRCQRSTAGAATLEPRESSLASLSSLSSAASSHASSSFMASLSLSSPSSRAASEGAAHVPARSDADIADALMRRFVSA